MATLRRKVDGAEYALGPEQVIGRSESCRPRLDHPAASSVHAQIRWSGRDWQVRDLGSRNGTFVDGARLAPGIASVLRDGCTLLFGDERETWAVVDTHGPEVRVLSLDDASAMVLSDQIIAIPSASSPVASVYQVGDRWVLEYAGSTRPVEHNDTFVCEGRVMRFECPVALAHTPMAGEQPCPLSAVTLVFRVSQNEEHVSLSLECPRGPRSLPQRSCHYLALTLARQRLADERARVAEPGWLDTEELLAMIPEYQTQMHLNVDVHRLRKQVGAANIVDAGRVIERRTGQLRIGTARLRVERES